MAVSDIRFIIMLKALVIKYMCCGFKKYGSPRHRGTVSYIKGIYSSLTTCTVAQIHTYSTWHL